MMLELNCGYCGERFQGEFSDGLDWDTNHSVYCPEYFSVQPKNRVKIG